MKIFDILRESLRSIQEQKVSDKEIIIVDNASSDQTTKMIKGEFPDVTLIESPTNLGYAGGNNKAIQKALEDKNCGYVALVNSDAVLSSDWTEVLIGAFRDNPKLATAQTPVFNYYNHNKIDSLGIVLNRNGTPVQVAYEENADQRSIKSKRIFGANAAAMMISRSFIEEQPFEDVFDEDLFMYFEDVDLATRANLLGWENWLVKGSEAYHVGSASKKRFMALRLIHRNNLLVLIKNLPSTFFKRMVRGYIKQELLSLGRPIKQMDPGALAAGIVGRIQSLFLIKRFYQKRKQLLPNIKIDTERLWKLM